MPGRFCLRFPGIPLGLLLLAGACGAKHPASEADGGRDEGSSERYPADALIAIGGPCTGNNTCDQDDPRVVRSCDPMNSGEIVETCDAAHLCRLGRCVTPACAAVWMSPTIAGCLFYTAALDNVDSDDGKPALITVANPGNVPATVSVEQRSVDQPWTAVDSTAIAPDSAGSFTIFGSPIQGGGLGDAVARRIVSDTPVTVMLVQSDDSDHDATSSAGTMLLPDHALGRRYMAMTYQQTPTPRMAGMPGALDGAGEIAIVATADRTALQIFAPGASGGAPAKDVWLANDGDVYQLISENDGDDLAGTVIQADKPVAVFSGNVVTAYGQAAPGINSPDMAMEQMLPTTEWSRTYVAARLPPQSSVCDSLFPASPDNPVIGPVSYWRIVSDKPARLTFVAPATVLGLPVGDVYISAGSPFSYTVSGTGDFIVHSTQPILMTQGMDCEATLSTAVPADAPLGPQLLALAPNFEHALAIVRKDEQGRPPPVILDGVNISSSFIPVAQGYAVARMTIPPCPGPVDKCVHRLLGAYGLTLRGMDVACSYAVTPATWTMCSDADACN